MPFLKHLGTTFVGFSISHGGSTVYRSSNEIAIYSKLILSGGPFKSLGEKDLKQLHVNEVRWHYSQHYLAERRGEEVIESMLQSTTTKKQRALLQSQLKDEKTHSNLFKEKIDQIGLDNRASRFADGYANLVNRQKSFPEKVFVFQILTEAVSAAYCQWRIDHVLNMNLNEVDYLVRNDEIRHLVMGKTLLSLCGEEEIKIFLPPQRQKTLIREMNELCEQTVRHDMYQTLGGEFLPKSSIGIASTNSLDRAVAHSVLSEYRDIKKTILKENNPVELK